MLDDNELHRAWLEGQSLTAIARAHKTSRSTLSVRVQRLRMREGEERWPHRAPAIHAATKPTSVKRAGVSTLPPLPSLQN